MTQYLDWKVGDRVVCVESPDLRNFYGDEVFPKKEGVYTIREIWMDADSETVVLRLVEIRNKPRPYQQGYMECGFFALRFRKVHPRKTSIAIFERLLLTQGNEVETA